MDTLLEKLNTPIAAVVALVLVLSVNGFLFFYYPRYSDQGPTAKEVQALRIAQAPPDPPARPEDPSRSATSRSKKELASKADSGKNAHQPKRSESRERTDRRDKHGKVQNKPTAAQQSSARTQPHSAPSNASLQDAPSVEASVPPAAPSQEAPPAAVPPAPTPTPPTPAPAPVIVTDTSTSRDQSGAGQTSPGGEEGGAPLAPAALTTQDVSPVSQIGRN